MSITWRQVQSVMDIGRLNSGAVIVLLLVGLALTGEARADYYKYTDGKGTICITNDPKAVPPKYRATMKVVKEEVPTAQDKGAVKEAPPEQAPVAEEHAAQQTGPTAAETSTGRTAARFPWLKPIIVVLGIMAAFVAVGKLASHIPSPLVSRIVLIAFFLGIFVFAYKAYATYIVDSYFTIKQKCLAMFMKANVRQAPETGE